MELSKQIKKYRKEQNLSQEDLAEKIHVTRHTISNWERDKNIPDLNSLILLSEIFNTSLDNLVKGDVKVMEKQLNNKRFNNWVWIMGISSILTAISVGPSLHYFGNLGYIIVILLATILVYSSIKIEKYKKQNTLFTYKQILDYMNGKPIKKINSDIKKHKIINAIISIIYIAIFITIFIISLNWFE
ncbi:MULTISPECIES: helix-turn-helix transcriptional regulator [Staphylococcus]|uniref:helix-turn-helix transcriptional regulator n=1 Tax=Staphylococcus TaxID=1279 RepID=UPI001EC2FE21|nr:helix-turn-helix transcriptional regulator [Staphylococcus sp.]MBS6062182.1 helix-turn-helix transcriptional regulator [Staphylococcus sp.]MDU1036393.1 helix-turn-helix transcriptional regulator [Staphylococcus sp.]MDU1858144.1 helix-turn-helix transcriptional regulator [Staphylococcus sp.]MDU2281664.1 helix-turn-helix transcriptional regulator [Staphylococcus sp.]MDU2594621.1 helix-turn-helix transcriptional regulator [Staphylococcus sp.]